MKKLAFILAFVMLISIVFCGCSEEKEKVEPENTTTPSIEEVRENTPEAAALRFVKVWNLFDLKALDREIIIDSYAYLEDKLNALAKEKGYEVLEFLNLSVKQWQAEYAEEHEGYIPDENVKEVKSIDEFLELSCELVKDLMYQAAKKEGYGDGYNWEEVVKKNTDQCSVKTVWNVSKELCTYLENGKYETAFRYVDYDKITDLKCVEIYTPYDYDETMWVIVGEIEGEWKTLMREHTGFIDPSIFVLGGEAVFSVNYAELNKKDLEKYRVE